MLKTFALLFLLFISHSISAQRKPKMEVTKDGDTLYSTKEQRLYTHPASKNAVVEYLKSTIYKSQSGISICFSIQTGRTNMFSIEAGSTAELRLENGDKVFLKARSESRAKGSIIAYGSYIFVFYGLSKKDIDALKGSTVDFIKISSSIGSLEYELKDKFGSIIAEQLKLME